MRSADPESFTGTDRFLVQRRLGADSGASLAARRSVDEVREELSRSSWRFSAEGRARGSAAG